MGHWSLIIGNRNDCSDCILINNEWTRTQDRSELQLAVVRLNQTLVYSLFS